MSIPKEYYDLVEEVRDEERDTDIVVIDDDTDYIPSSEVNDVAVNYMDTLTMERCEPEQHTLELIPILPKVEPELTEVHIDDEYFDSLLEETAEYVTDIPNGWTLEEFIAILAKSNAMEHV